MTPTRTQLLGEIPLTVTVPSGYHPPSSMAPSFLSQGTEMSATSYEGGEYIPDLTFLDAQYIMIRLFSAVSSLTSSWLSS